jgi:hypothetical protein
MGQSRRWLRVATIAAAVMTASVLGYGVATAGTVPTVHATGRGAGGHDAVLGSWRITATVTDPVPNTAHALVTFTPGGGLIETRLLAKAPIPGVVDFPTLETPGHGGWKRVGPRTYEVKYVYFIQDANGSDLLGTETVYWRATISHDGRTISGPGRSEVHLADGTLAVSWTFTGNGTRIEP